MAIVSPLRGVHFNPEHMRLDGVLAPPYDVISDERREELYAADLRNIVRIDYCRPEPADVPGVLDRYVRAAQHLGAWFSLDLLVRDQRPAFYVHDHEFIADDGMPRRRRGLFARIPATTWDRPAILPHERTLRGPKEDRLALLRATAMQTSAVFGLWDRAPGIDDALGRVTGDPPLLTGRTGWDEGAAQHALWATDDPAIVGDIAQALAASTLYVADGHHRYETAVAYAQERRAAEPAAPAGADFEQVLVYLCAADDPAIDLLPTHRLVYGGDRVPETIAELGNRLGAAFSVETASDLRIAQDRIATLRDAEHAFAVQGSDGVAVLRTPRRRGTSPRRSLDAVVLEESILEAACGVTPERVAEGALAYTRSLADVDRAVRSGAAALGVVVNPCTTAQLLAVADAGEVMPQKSTYFSPKVPTGLVLAPL
jgi:uncharacterized protein (DUF1015 family)